MKKNDAIQIYDTAVKDRVGEVPKPNGELSSELIDGSWELVDSEGEILAVVSSDGRVAHSERYVFTIHVSGFGTTPQEAWADCCKTIVGQLDEFLDESDVPDWQLG